MAFFDNFPYTNFHELNLDWIIRVVKEISTQFPSIITDLDKKLNKPVNAGSFGQVLVNLGNDITKWSDLDEEFIPVIIQAVNDWLDEHPEATTTVQDASLTLAKMTEFTAYEITRKESGLIAPVYIGDYLQPNTILPSSCVYVNGKFYCVNAPENNYAEQQHSGLGIVSIYNVATNQKEADVNILVGHGNSIAFDGTFFYIAPVWEYGETRVDTNKVYKYNTSFALIEEIIAPSRIMGISYDSHTESLYMLDYFGKVYKYANNAFTIYTLINNWNDFYGNENIVLNNYYNQDIAVNNGEFYISSPCGNILHGKLEESYSYVTDYMQLLRTDSTTRYIIGELEGMEFTDDHLYAMVYTMLPNDVKNAFVVELPVNHINATSPVMTGDFTVRDATLTLSAGTQSKFFLNTYEIRSMLQLFDRTLNASASQVQIPAGSTVVDDYNIFIPSQNIGFLLDGVYTCKNITVSGGELTFIAGNSNNLIIFTDGEFCIELRRAGNLRFSGDTQLNVSTPNRLGDDVYFIVVGSTQAQTVIRPAIVNVQSKTLLIGSEKIRSYEVYHSSTPTIFLSHTMIFAAAFGYLSNANKDVHILIRTPKAIPSNNVTMTGTIVIRGNKGYLDDQMAGFDTSGMVKQFYKLDDYTLEIVMNKENITEFTNCDNNVPLTITGSMTFTFN